MNKKISTPIAIGIILVLAVVVGGFIWWQYQEMVKEENKSLLKTQNLNRKIENCSNFKFEDYPIKEIYKGEIAKVDFRNNPQNNTAWKAIENGASEGPNFAGHFVVISWNCGYSCQNSAIVNNETGKIIKSDIITTNGLSYKIDSSLFIIGALNHPEEGIEYYEVKDDKLNLICKIKNQGIEEETISWKNYNTEKFSFKYSDDVWQLGDKNLSEYYKIEVYLVNKQIENCEAWLGIDAGNGVCKNPVFILDSKCYTDEVVECVGMESIEEGKIGLNNEFFARREIEGSSFEKRIQAWYDIYDQKSNDVYCGIMISLPENEKEKCAKYEACPRAVLVQECLDSFEQILKTLKFKD
jgi:hypothetical protein